MAIKLLAAKMISTSFYLVLDADLILLRPFTIKDLIQEDRAVYQHESRDVHESWWRGSETLLQVGENYWDRLNASISRGNAPGFSVTPAVLSTYGSLLVIGRLKELYCRSTQLCVKVESGSDRSDAPSVPLCSSDCSDYLMTWLNGFGHNGAVWSEYTLYRVTLDYYEVIKSYLVAITAHPS